jgi:hypothetical protein
VSPQQQCLPPITVVHTLVVSCMHAAATATAQASGDKATLKAMAQEAGYRSKYMDEDVIFNMTRFALDTDGPEASHLILYNNFVNCYTSDRYAAV